MSELKDLMQAPAVEIHKLTDDLFTINGVGLVGTFSEKVQLPNQDDFGPRYRWVMTITANQAQFSVAAFVAAMTAAGCPVGDDGVPILIDSTVEADGMVWILREFRKEGNAFVLGLVEEGLEVRP